MFCGSVEGLLPPPSLGSCGSDEGGGCPLCALQFFIVYRSFEHAIMRTLASAAIKAYSIETVSAKSQEFPFSTEADVQRSLSKTRNP